MSKKVSLTLREQIDRTLKAEGRKQGWIVNRMNESGHALSETDFSNKKYGRGGKKFSTEEIKTLEEILGTEISV